MQASAQTCGVVKALVAVVAKALGAVAASPQEHVHSAATSQLCKQLCSSFQVQPLSVEIVQLLHKSVALKSCSEMPLLPQQLQPLRITI